VFKQLPVAYARYQQLIDSSLAARLQGIGELSELMMYTALAPGKRLRPVLVCFSAQAVGGSGDSVVLGACAVEFLHAASLILDDLPCMDDAVLRRWRQACHVVFGEQLWKAFHNCSYAPVGPGS
jgi:geranylgeranyl diphosphate synthase type II